MRGALRAGAWLWLLVAAALLYERSAVLLASSQRLSPLVSGIVYCEIVASCCRALEMVRNIQAEFRQRLGALGRSPRRPHRGRVAPLEDRDGRQSTRHDELRAPPACYPTRINGPLTPSHRLRRPYT